MSTRNALPDAATPCDRTPVVIDAAAIDTTPSGLREARDELAAADCVSARLDLEATFCEDCRVAIQDEVDRITRYVEAADYLGAARVHVDAEVDARESLVEDAMAVCRERAESAGIALDFSRR